MSRPAPSSKNNFLQTLLIMTLVFMGMQLFFKGNNNNQVPEMENRKLVTKADYRWALQLADAKVLESTAKNLQGQYNNLVDEDLQKKVITQDEANAEKVEGTVLVADAWYKAGLLKNDTNKIRTGYQMLQGYQRKLAGQPAWNAPVTITNPDNKTTSSTSGQQMFTKVVETLKVRNRSDLVYGLIPGGWQLIDSLVHLTGAIPSFSYAFAGFLLAVLLRAIVFPLAQKQLMSSRQMSQLMPRIKEIKEKYPSDPTVQNQKVMEMYREYGINPFSGCWPAFVQMPLFLTVYQCMLHYQFQFQNGTFLWINPALSKATGGIIAPNLGEQDYILIVIYGITMLISTLLTPVTDPTQKSQQRLMGVGMAIFITVLMFMGIFPVVSGFVLYWTFLNILATAQALRAYRLPMPPLVKVNTPAGGVYPSSGIKGKWAQMIDDMQHRMAEEQRKGIGASNSPTETDSAPDNPSTNGKPTNGKPTNGKMPGKSTGKKPSSGQGTDDGGSSETPKHKPKKRA